MATSGTPSPTPPGASARPAPDPARRRLILWIVAAVVFVLLLIGAWVGVRGLLAKNELESALPAAKQVQTAVVAGDLATAKSAATTLRKHAAAAASLTGDPVWRVAEFFPLLGSNLTAVRVAAASTDQLASQVIDPLVGVAGQVDPRAIKPVDKKIDLGPIEAAKPVVVKAQAAFHTAKSNVDGIDTEGTLPQVTSAVERLQTQLGKAAGVVDAVGNSVRLLPPMLGADGPRTYLVLVQNPAELRATGGLVGALALIKADHGAITLEAQSSGTSIGPWPSPVSAIPASTQGLYGPLLGRFIQDVNLTPHFPLAATTAATMWKETHGGTVDGVLTIDPVVLTGLLKATGPVALPTGDMLTSANAIPLLLSESYKKFALPEEQDAYFASAATAVFDSVASGKADGAELVKALANAGADRRLLVWSAHPEEQKVLAPTTLAGGLPESTPSTAGLGVYFNDATGAKMDYYLKAKIEAGTAICRVDGKPTSRVSVTLTNTAPADAGTTLPDYVTGAGTYGVPPGNIRTRVAVYGAEDGLLVSTTSGGAPYATISGTDAKRPVSVFTVELAPGESKTVSVDLLDVKQTAPGMDVFVTPTLPKTTPDVGGSGRVSVVALDCGSTVK
ncbi:DUF4012 domain-containing protein [Leifsonia lichenia]